jgi:hypothetical protein
VTRAVPRRDSLAAPLGLAVAAALALGACKSQPKAAEPASGNLTGVAGGSDAVAVAGGPTGGLTERDMRFVRVDSLIVQWDGQQSDGREEEARALAGKIREEVDADYPAFVSFARGEAGLRRQYLGVQALGFASDRGATSILVDRLAEGDPQLVGNALIALKLRADPATPLPPIDRLLHANAVEPKRFSPLALANVVLARERANLAVSGQDAAEAMTGLVGLIQDRDPIVRLHAAKAMGALRRPEAIDFLVLLLKDEHPRIRVAAAAALERIGDPRAFPQVVALLDGTDQDIKPFVRDVLFSYAERLTGAPLAEAQRASLGLSARAWDRWFADRVKTARRPG